MENFIENRYKDLIKKEKSEIYTLTHSYMDVLQTSGSDILPNIGARHMYYSVRKI